MTYINHGPTRLIASLLATITLILLSSSAAAQQKTPTVQKEPEKIQQQQEEAPDRPETFRRLPEGRDGLPDWTPKAGKLREVDCSGTETVQFLPIDVYPLLPIHHDTELGGKQKLTIEARVSHSAGRVFLRGHVTLKEHSGSGLLSSFSRSEFRSHFAFDSIVLKKGCVIDHVSPTDGVILDEGNKTHRWESVYGADLIASAKCIQDTRGDDEGKVGCREIKLRPIEVSYRKANESTRCSTARITPRTVPIFPVRDSRRGNYYQDMDGNRVDIFLDSSTEIVDTPDGAGQELFVQAGLTLVEIHEWPGRAMRARGEGGQRNVFLTAFDAPGCRISSVRPGSGTLRGKSEAGEHNPRVYGRFEGGAGSASGMIDYAICRTDTKGKDNGRIGCTEIVYNALIIDLEPQ